MAVEYWRWRWVKVEVVENDVVEMRVVIGLVR